MRGGRARLQLNARLGVREVVDDAAGRAHDDVRALRNCNSLRHHINASNEHSAAHADDSSERLELRAVGWLLLRARTHSQGVRYQASAKERRSTSRGGRLGCRKRVSPSQVAPRATKAPAAETPARVLPLLLRRARVLPAGATAVHGPRDYSPCSAPAARSGAPAHASATEQARKTAWAFREAPARPGRRTQPPFFSTGARRRKEPALECARICSHAARAVLAVSPVTKIATHLKNGNGESACFPRARLRKADDVLPCGAGREFLCAACRFGRNFDRAEAP